MYYECTECGQLASLVGHEQSPVSQECPVCEEVTSWEIAFEAEGVSF